MAVGPTTLEHPNQRHSDIVHSLSTPIIDQYRLTDGIERHPRTWYWQRPRLIHPFYRLYHSQAHQRRSAASTPMVRRLSSGFRQSLTKMLRDQVARQMGPPN